MSKVNHAQTVTKSDLAGSLAASTKVSVKDAKTYVDELLNSIVAVLIRGDNIELRGFGSFRHVHRKGRTARNIITGEPMQIAAHTAVKFKPSKELKGKLHV